MELGPDPFESDPNLTSGTAQRQLAISADDGSSYWMGDPFCSCGTPSVIHFGAGLSIR